MNQAISDLFQLELPQLEARLARLLGDIMPPDEAARAACKARWDAVGKPLGSLGLLETDTQKIAALTGSAKLDLSARTLLVFCADNGVVAQGVSQCGNEVTGFVTRALAEGRSSACTMARVARCRVQPVDMGVHGLVGEEIPGLVRCRVMDGTADFTQGPAMTRTQALQALLAGAALARQQAEAGCRLLLIGEMGIGNTTTSSAVAAVLLGCPPEAVTGRGAGLSNAGFARKLAAIRAADMDIKIVLFRNHTLGLVHQIQSSAPYHGPFGVALDGSPDFETIAAAYRVPCIQVGDEDHLDEALDRFLGTQGSCLLICEVHPDVGTND